MTASSPVVGFTGTRAGMTPQQAETVRRLLRELRPREFHHGDCEGADAQAHEIARGLGLRIIIHPPEYGKHRAWCLGAATVLDVKPYMDRNEDIVAACSVLIGTPQQPEEVLRSGTWATVRRGWKSARDVRVVAPDGSVSAARQTPSEWARTVKREARALPPAAEMAERERWFAYLGSRPARDALGLGAMRACRLALRVAVPRCAWRVELKTACFMVETEDGVVVETAPYGRYLLGRSILSAWAAIARQGGKLERLSDGARCG